MTLIGLARRSLGNRALAAALTAFTIALSVGLLVVVEQMRGQVREGFYRSVSGTDLIVGAPTAPVQLLLFTVFGLGQPPGNVSMEAYQEIAAEPGVAWTIPISVGDAFRGFRVVGTTNAMFEHYRYAGKQPLAFAAGGAFDDLFDTVVGHRVAAEEGLAAGDGIELGHGGGSDQLHFHEGQPFRVAGVLAPTGTPVDQSVYIRLAAHEAIHVGWERGVPPPGATLDPDEARALVDDQHDDHDHDHDREHGPAGEGGRDLEPDEISAFFVGLHNRAQAFALRYRIQEREGEPLLAILPGIALQQLWRITGLAEQVLRIVSALVVAAGLLGMLTALVTTLDQRRREMAILRACGARPWQISALLVAEAGMLAAAGIVLGIALAAGLQWLASGWLLARFGVAVAPAVPDAYLFGILGAIWLAALLVALLPAAMVYRRTLADGMQVKQ